MLRRFNAQSSAIREKCLDVFLGVFTQRHTSRGRVGNDPVVHVGQVHDVIHLEAAQLQEPSQHILKHESAEIPDVRVVVDRRPAGIHLHFTGLLRYEDFHLS